jgi:hypothetical protein
MSLLAAYVCLDNTPILSLMPTKGPHAKNSRRNELPRQLLKNVMKVMSMKTKALVG